MPRPSVEDERREQILRATWAVISAEGFRSLRLSDVARQAGISAGMIHYYFESKEQLLRAAFERYFEHSVQRRKPITDSGKPPLQLLKLLVKSYLPIEDETIEGWRVWGELWVEGLQAPELQQLNEEFYGQWRRTIAGVIREGQERGTIRDGDATTLANMLVAMLDGLAIQVILNSRSMTAERMRTTCYAYIDQMHAAS
jgi:AcrR family transcriptional regulator